jgi:antitoxin CptB
MGAQLYDIAAMTAQNSDPTEPPIAPPLDNRRRRLLFRANYRGTHENDLLIGGFVVARISAFTDAEIEALEAILEYPEVDLADWLSGRRPVPAECESPMLRAMCEAAIPKPASGT